MGSTRKVILVIIIVACMAGIAIAGRFKQRRPVEQISSAAADAGAPTAVRPLRLSSPEECARNCEVGGPALTCHYTFVVEFYATLTNACKLCTSNATTRLVDDCQCITADGYEISGIITVNRMYPGPSIVVCEGDNVIVDVDNRVMNNEVTIHWHGIQQRGTQYYDGVPFVTQCPVPEGTTFRYQWRAASAGTHFWHSHSGLQKAAGFEGAIIIREPKATEPYNELWDEEDINHVIFIGDWYHDSIEEHFPGTVLRRPGQTPDNILINGMGRWTDPATGNTTTTPRAVFVVKPGRRYRFRMINSASGTCSYVLTIQRHKLTVIATDGEPVKPVTVDSINSLSAERYDFLITADKNAKSGDFWIQVHATGVCQSKQLQQLAILRYAVAGQTAAPPSKEPTYTAGLGYGVVLNQLNVRCNNRKPVPNAVCVTQLESVEPVPPALLKKNADVQLFVGLAFHGYKVEDVFKPGTYDRFLVNGGRQFASMVNDISNVFPPSPLISQINDIPEGQICEPGKVPAKCATSKPCFCTHVEHIPYGSTVELIVVDEAHIPGLSHPFHLHGFAFHVLSHGCGDDYNITSITVDVAKDLDKRGKIIRQMKNPPAKDTFALPNNGFSIIRFIADNPGYWLFHCHFLAHLVDGMSLIFHVGKPEQLPPIPRGFPKCGNFLGQFEL